ncbi:GNAT family N-acetyltransferase [Anaerotignum lactatifermentans]|uniref:GNAT family N-acetyltransferase n=1 Tax=Anaerotignum lactatifermentans TaxID=160404 RepID=UPI003AF0082B
MKEDDKILDIDAGEYSLYFVRLPHLHLRKPEPLGMTEDLLFVGGKELRKIQYENLTLRQAEAADAKQLAAWWNNGAVMAHAGFPNGLGTTEEEVIEGLDSGRMIIEESDRLIGECNYRNLVDGVAEIGIKICETDDCVKIFSQK